MPVLITRPDIVYVDAAGVVWNSAGGGSHGGDQHAWRRHVAQHAAARPGSRRGSVHQGRRAALPESGGVRDAEAGHVRQPRAQLDPRAEFRQIDMVVSKRMPLRPGRQRRAPRRDLQPLQHHELRESGIGATLPNALPGAGETATQANRVQPGQPFTRHVGRHVRTRHDRRSARPSAWAPTARCSSRCGSTSRRARSSRSEQEKGARHTAVPFFVRCGGRGTSGRQQVVEDSIAPRFSGNLTACWDPDQEPASGMSPGRAATAALARRTAAEDRTPAGTAPR